MDAAIISILIYDERRIRTVKIWYREEIEVERSKREAQYRVALLSFLFFFYDRKVRNLSFEKILTKLVSVLRKAYSKSRGL